MAFLYVFFVLAVKSQNQCLYLSPFWFSKNLNYPPKIQILTNVKTSPPQENIKKLVMMFLFGSKKVFSKVFLVLAALDLLLFVLHL